MANIDWVKIVGTALSAFVSALIVGALWYGSVNHSIADIEDDTKQNTELIKHHIAADNKQFYEVQAQINAVNIKSEIDKALLREISLRLNRMENKMDKWHTQ
jgi:hypothetical protein